VDMKIQGDLVRSDDDSMCGGTNPHGGVTELTCEESLFSAESCGKLCTQCNWGYADETSDLHGSQKRDCDNLPDPDPTPPSEQACEESGCSFDHAQEACGSLKSHSVAFEGCLLDVCSACESDEEQTEIAQVDLEDEEGSNPGPACVDEGDTCGLPTAICTEAVKLNTMTVSQNNLAGKGPDSGAEEIRYLNAAAVDGKVLDLVVKSVGGAYKGKTAKNGKKGQFGSLNMRAGANVELEFSFVESSSGEPVVLKSVALSFFDLDEGKNGKSRTTITACDARNAILTTNTELSLARPNNCYAVASTLHGGASNNPSGPARLTPAQAGRSVTFDFAQVSSLRITLALGKGHGPRNTFWAFEPALACLDGSDPDMPLVPAVPVDPNVPTEEVCPIITKGDGLSWRWRPTNQVSIGPHHSFISCFNACRQRCPDCNGVTSSAAFKGSKYEKLGECFCEGATPDRRQVATDPKDVERLNVFCPVWKPNCNLDLADACIRAQVARGGLLGVTFNDYE